MKSIHGGDIYNNKVNMDFSVNINPLEIKYSPEILGKKSGAAVIDRVLAEKDDKYSDYYSDNKSSYQAAK